MFNKMINPRTNAALLICSAAFAFNPATAWSQDSTASDNNTVAAINRVGEDLGKSLIYEQGDNSFSANEYIGATVWNLQNQDVGDINDLILSKDGQVQAVVIGVGGFLGLGEKDVAIDFDAVTTSENSQTGAVKFIVDASADQLAAAPAFVTRAQKLALKRADELNKLAPKSGGIGQPLPANPAQQGNDESGTSQQ